MPVVNNDKNVAYGNQNETRTKRHKLKTCGPTGSGLHKETSLVLQDLRLFPKREERTSPLRVAVDVTEHCHRGRARSPWVTSWPRLLVRGAATSGEPFCVPCVSLPVK